jgi:hypothetical protein
LPSGDALPGGKIRHRAGGKGEYVKLIYLTSLPFPVWSAGDRGKTGRAGRRGPGGKYGNITVDYVVFYVSKAT